MSGSNLTHCYHFINATVVDISIYGAATVIGAVSSLTAIILILVAKAYKEFIYRLVLYMAVDAFIVFLAIIALIFEIEYNIGFVISTPTFLLKLYMIYMYAFLLCWLGLYLFLLAVFRVQLKKAKHEAIGLMTVLVTPLTFLWVFPVIYKCEDDNNINFVFFLNLPHYFSTLLSCILIGAVLITLCKNAVNRVENTLQQQHRKAVNKILPYVVFVMTYQVADIIYLVILAYQTFLIEEKSEYMYITALWPIIVVSLPILLLCEPHIRCKIKCRRSQRYLANNTAHAVATIHQSTGVSQPSDTHYSIQHESSVSSTCGDTSHSHIAVSPTVHGEHERQPLLNKALIGSSLHLMQ